MPLRHFTHPGIAGKRLAPLAPSALLARGTGMRAALTWRLFVARVVFRSNRQHGDLAVEVPAGTTLLEASKDAHGAVGDACGGNCACSTCHVYVISGQNLLSEMDDKESDRLDLGFDVRSSSRLACQARVEGDGEVVCEITQESLEAFENEHPEHRQ